MDMASMESYSVNRPVLPQTVIDDKYLRSLDDIQEEKWQPSVSCHPRRALFRLLPCIEWFSSYKWNEYLLKDIIAGTTVAIMNIPQGMAYALLGNVPPVVGIYMAFFPVIIYALLGTSRHISMGSFAVICLMSGKVVAERATPEMELLAHNGTEPFPPGTLTPIQVGTAVTFMVALFQLVMFGLRLGVVSSLLSETLINGFTAGAAVHVLTSQIKDVFGVRLPKESGPFSIVQTYINLFYSLKTANLAAVVMSAITMAVLIINNEILKPWVQKRTIIPIPIELIVVLFGTLFSSYCGLDNDYHLKTVGHIDVGLPSPTLPAFRLLPSIALESLVIAVIAYVISLSMALIFANRKKYTVDANQELLAQGCGNLVGSFFSCLPFAASLSRSVIQESVGGCTQLTSLVSSSILLFVLLWISPFFEPLPRCILSSLIVVALKGVLFQVFDLHSIWRASRLDGLVWLVTYLTVVLIEIDVGLLVGVLASLGALLLRGLRADITALHRIPATDLYVDPSKYHKTESLSGVTVIRYSGCINFINKKSFRKTVLKMVDVDSEHSSKKIAPKRHGEFVVLDFGCLHYVDPSGGGVLLSTIKEIEAAGITILIAGTSGLVRDVLKELSPDAKHLCLFPTVHDAVMYAQSRLEDAIYTIRL